MKILERCADQDFLLSTGCVLAQRKEKTYSRQDMKGGDDV